MRTSITIGYPASGAPVVVFGPEVPMDKQKTALKQLRASGIDEDFIRVELWESGAGLTRTVKLQSAADAKKKQAKLSEDQASQKASQSKPVKSQKAAVVEPPSEEPDGPTLEQVAQTSKT